MDRLSDVMVFVQVVERGSLSAAADAMGMSRGVISKALARLAARLQTRLLQRTTRRLSLTEAGAAFFEKKPRRPGARRCSGAGRERLAR
ncbi:LysR family transcriptional regulator [Ralstonia sp. TCR112]|uniref:LysR family transcriptional regulator n=1 Tax=Ralstonia sp. TCR112 TaxID=2601730 RepID=UPI0021C3FA1F|nr:LysR family transcriptional regulator [Ralstonia sp. TCR112]